MAEYFDRVETPAETVARQIAETRRRQGLTKQDLADRLGMDRATVHRIEAGERRVTVAELVEVAAALHVAPVNLAVPRGDLDGQVIAGVPVYAADARAWWRGRAIPGEVAWFGADGTADEASPGLDVDERRYYAEVGDDEWRAFHEQPGVRELLDAVDAVVAQAGRDDDLAGPALVAHTFRTVEAVARHHAEQLERRAEEG